MTPGIRPLVAGNWKMNGLKADGGELKRIMEGFVAPLPEHVDLLVCPPATLTLAFAAMAEDSFISVGAQDCHTEASGAYTGDISAEMLADAGARAVIVGHSERRTGHDETDDIVRAKVHAAWRAGLMAIVCVGETESERKDGEALATVGAQLDVSVPDRSTADWLVVAYEPVWAIGTGLTPTASEVGEMHGFIRERLGARFGVEGATTRVLYGGSVKPDNAAELMAVSDVDGALVGGASLKAADFLQIAAACAHIVR